jgi:hypothetical protein
MNIEAQIINSLSSTSHNLFIWLFRLHYNKNFYLHEQHNYTEWQCPFKLMFNLDILQLWNYYPPMKRKQSNYEGLPASTVQAENTCMILRWLLPLPLVQCVPKWTSEYPRSTIYLAFSSLKDTISSMYRQIKKWLLRLRNIYRSLGRLMEKRLRLHKEKWK